MVPHFLTLCLKLILKLQTFIDDSNRHSCSGHRHGCDPNRSTKTAAIEMRIFGWDGDLRLYHTFLKGGSATKADRGNCSPAGYLYTKLLALFRPLENIFLKQN
jgi:hypothetical protein